MRHSEQLRRKISLVSSSLERVSDRLAKHPNLREMFPAFLCFTHCIVRASVPLMETALESAQRQPTSDVVAPHLARYLSKHIEEEKYHDDWLLEDIEVLGWERTRVLSIVPPCSVAALVGSQYYWIRHCHPIALLGYVAVMEGDPPSPQLLEELMASTGLPLGAFRTFSKHAEIDTLHRSDLDEALDEMPLGSVHSGLLGISAFQTVSCLTLALEQFIASCPASAVPFRVREEGPITGSVRAVRK